MKKSTSLNETVAVLMTAFNSEKFISVAIKNVLDQTLGRFIFYIIDDGSTDRTIEVIESFQDDRIILFKNERNLGVGASLNKWWDFIKADYLFRMDSDDLCEPDRFEKSLKFLETNPEFLIVGTFYRVLWGENITQIALTPIELRTLALFECPLLQSTILINKRKIDEFGISYQDLRVAEDYQFYIDCLLKGDIALIPEPLVVYQRHKQALGFTSYKLQDELSLKIRLNLLNRLSSLKLNDYQKMLYSNYLFNRISKKDFRLEDLKHTLALIRESYFNQADYRLDPNYYIANEYHKLKFFLIKNKVLGWNLLYQYINSYLFDFRVFLFWGLLLRIFKFKISNIFKSFGIL